MNQVIRDFQQMLRMSIGEQRDLLLKLTDSPVLIEADRSQFEQILMNLTVNARDAMPKGGRVTIETAVVHKGPIAQAVLTFSDTGCGMTEETQRHIFEPFFTTKEQGKGTGLGLSTVFGIVKQHGGDIEVDSRPGEGTGCIMTFALAADTGHTTGTDAESVDWRWTGSETIIVVEDDRQVLKLVTQILRSAGYGVLPFATPQDGLQYLLDAESVADLLLSDILMPGFDGIALYERVRTRRPDMSVLFMSGYTGEEMDRHLKAHESLRFIQKPFSTEYLLQRVRGAIDA